MHPKRFFAFGCSFTHYSWATWANILGYDLHKKYGTEFINYGAIGAGNEYISNSIAFADLTEKFNKDDLVIVCWTNISRIDKWISKERRWMLRGNIWTGTTDAQFLRQIDFEELLLKNLNYIYHTSENLKSKCNVKFYSMIPIWQLDQYNITRGVATPNIDTIRAVYKDYFANTISQSYAEFFSKYEYKYPQDRHPSPQEHAEFISEDYKLSDETIERVKIADKRLGEIFNGHQIDKDLPDEVYTQLNKSSDILKMHLGKHRYPFGTAK